MLDVKEIDEKMVFTLNSQRSPQKVKLLHLEWAVITQLDGEKTVGQIAVKLALNREEIQEIFKKLIDEELLELVNRSDGNRYVPIDFFDNIAHEMTLLLGPVAGIVLQDVLENMRKNREHFEKNQLPALVDLLTNQIDDPMKQKVFQKRIYPKIRSYIF